jgi:regulator of replication initiation timing
MTNDELLAALAKLGDENKRLRAEVERLQKIVSTSKAAKKVAALQAEVKRMRTKLVAGGIFPDGKPSPL